MARKPNTYFQFQQFRVDQGQCAMKVSLDACIFGALIDVSKSQRILDIGTGTGLLSLMVAQRCGATIDAVELDEKAAQQARDNFQQSPWADRLNLIHSAVQQYDAPELYDTFICNPPFFEHSLTSPDAARSLARHTDSLTFKELASAIQTHLAEGGQAWILLSTASSEAFLKEVHQTNRLQPVSVISLRPNRQRPDHRNIHVVRKSQPSEKNDRTIRQLTLMGENQGYTTEIKRLLGEYFLKGVRNA